MSAPADVRAALAACGYAELPGLLGAGEIGPLRAYHRQLLHRGAMRFGDPQCRRRHAAHDEPAARGVQHRVLPVAAAAAGAALRPSYTYTVTYEEGAVLPRHVDRPQCDYSVSLLVDYWPEPAGPSPWPLVLDTPHGLVAIRQSLGDGLLYRGCRLPHGRPPLWPGHRSTSLLLHYVDASFAGSLD